MTVDPGVLPGLLLLALEMLALAVVGYVVARVALRQQCAPLALAQGLVIGPAIWGLVANFLFNLLPGPTGALGAWLVTLAFGAWLAWRTPKAWRMPLREVAGFATTVLVIFWVALAARQLLMTPDAPLRLGLAASIQAGNWPPAIPWSPWQPVPYHYGAALLAAHLAPPVGPDLSFTIELLGAYAWTSLAMIMGTTLRQRGGWVSWLTLTPLLLTAGAWTLVFDETPVILQLPVPTSFTELGAGTSLGNVYWPAPEWPWKLPEPQASPPNIFKPLFTLGYALAFTVLERVTTHPRPSALLTPLTLAGLVGFLGLLEEAVAATTLGVWAVVEVSRVIAARPPRIRDLELAKGATLGLVAATLLLVFGGGVISGLLAGSAKGSLALRWIDDPNNRLLLGSVESLPGSLGVLGLGPLAVTALALLLSRRDRLILALAVGGIVFMLASLMLEYKETPDLIRLDGHARNFGLFALLLALATRLSLLRAHWRNLSVLLIIGLVAWPTLVAPMRNIRHIVESGVQLRNAQPGHQAFSSEFPRMGRSSFDPFANRAVTRYVTDHTGADERILSPHPTVMSVATGRPNASGFAELLHLRGRTGAEYDDAIRYLEPAAIRRLGFAYVHATDSWVATLPTKANLWLDDPELFEPVIRDGTDALYRIQPAFLRLDMKPAPQSYEALRQAIPASATVYLTEGLQRLDKLRLASALAHARLMGTIDVSAIHPLADIPIEPPGAHAPNVVVFARDLYFDLGDHGYPVVWWNSDAIAYATNPSIAPAIDPPPAGTDFAVRLSDFRTDENRVTFTATSTDQAPREWTGQDWLVFEVDGPPWLQPIHKKDDGYTLVGAQWFPGQIGPSGRTELRRYEFDALAGTLVVGNAAGDLAPVLQSADGLTPGVWVLAARLRRDYLQAAIIPILKIVVSESEQVTYTAYSGERTVALDPCPERMQHTDACRHLMATASPGSSS